MFNFVSITVKGVEGILEPLISTISSFFHLRHKGSSGPRRGVGSDVRDVGTPKEYSRLRRPHLTEGKKELIENSKNTFLYYVHFMN